MRKAWRYVGLTTALVCLFAIALVMWPARYPPAPESGTSRVIVNTRIVDVVAGTVGPPQTIVIRNGTIAGIIDSQVATGLPQWDAQGAYAIPAFWDMHVHTFQASPQIHFPLWVANGVLNVRDMMDCPGVSDTLIACAKDKRDWNRQVAAGSLAAPRIVEVASFYLASEQLAPTDARAQVQEAHARGLDAIKVYDNLSPAAYRAAGSEADRLGLKLVGHLPRAVTLQNAIDAGQDSFEHAHLLPRRCSKSVAAWREGGLDRLPPATIIELAVADFDAERCDAIIEQLAAADAWLVPTHVTRADDVRSHAPATASHDHDKYLDPLSRWAWEDDMAATRSAYAGPRGRRALRSYFDHGLRLTKRASDAGVGILVGTDTVLGGLRYHEELNHLADAGLSPVQVLQAATIAAAKFAGEEKTSGSITIGKRADIVLLSGNPLADISNSKRIRAVVHGGRLYDRRALDHLLEFTQYEAWAPSNWAKLIWGFSRSSMTSEM